MKYFLLNLLELVLKFFALIALGIIKIIQKLQRSRKVYNIGRSAVQVFFEYLIIGFVLFYAIIFFPWLGELVKALLDYIGIKTVLIIIAPLFFLRIMSEYKTRVSIDNELDSKDYAEEKGELEKYYNDAIISTDCYLDIANNDMKKYQSLSIGSLTMALIPILLTSDFVNIFQEIISKTTTFTYKIIKIELEKIQITEIAYFIMIAFFVRSIYKYVMSNARYRDIRLKQMRFQQGLNEYKNRKAATLR